MMISPKCPLYFLLRSIQPIPIGFLTLLVPQAHNFPVRPKSLGLTPFVAAVGTAHQQTVVGTATSQVTTNFLVQGCNTYLDNDVIRYSNNIVTCQN